MRVAPQCWPFAVPLAFLALGAGWLFHPAWSLPAVALLAFTLWFFRDPERATPDVPGAWISPADGRVIRATPASISIFMNVFNVHVCRSPVAGTIESVEHTPGRFLAAFKDEAPEQNERTEIVVADGANRVRFTLIAGLIARRIVCWVEPGQAIRAGQRVGLIRFGSRVDVYPAAEASISVQVGHNVKAGETVLCRPETMPAAVGDGAI